MKAEALGLDSEREVLAVALNGRVRELAEGEARPLYVRRQVLNGAELVAWAKAQGFETTLPAEDLHVTIAFSHQPVNWLSFGKHVERLDVWNSPGERRLLGLGSKGEACVLQFHCHELHERWESFLNGGASWDWPDYHPHITLSYSKPEGLRLETIEPYKGVLSLGPEIFEALDEDWREGIKEHATLWRSYWEQWQRNHAQQSVNFSQMKETLDKLEARALRDLREVMVEWRDALSRKVTKAAAGGGLQKLAADLRLPRRGDFTVAMQEALRRAWERGARDARREVREARREARTHAGEGSFTPRAALRWLGEKAFWITGITGDKVLHDVQAAILQSIKTGRPLGETILAIAQVFAPYIGDESVIGDEKQTQPYRLETVVRTNTTEAYNHGRLTEFVSKEMLPFLVGVRYSAVLDERTTEVCRFLDGRVFRPGQADLESLLPPNHFNCRSVVVAVVVGEAVPAEAFITVEQIGHAKSLADAKFLSLKEAA